MHLFQLLRKLWSEIRKCRIIFFFALFCFCYFFIVKILSLFFVKPPKKFKNFIKRFYQGNNLSNKPSYDHIRQDPETLFYFLDATSGKAVLISCGIASIYWLCCTQEAVAKTPPVLFSCTVGS